MKRVSVHDVAAEAGVAIGSVSRALNGGKHVSAQLRARVAAAAERLGYQPNAQARGLRLGRSNTIGLLVNDVRHPMYTAAVASIERELSAHGQMMLLANAQGDLARERTILQTFERSAVDGAIITPSIHDEDAQRDHYAHTRLPVVLVDWDGPGIDRVCLERRQATRVATRHLLTLGHRRIALVTPALDRTPGGERLAGYGDALRQAGLAVDMALVPTLASPLQDGRALMQQLLDVDDPPTALICLGTQLLSGAMRALRLRGLAVPRDFSIIAIGAPEMMDFADPPLTCLRMDLVGVGREAARMLLHRLAVGPSAAVQRLEIEPELIVRESCGPVRPRTPFGTSAGTPTGS